MLASPRSLLLCVDRSTHTTSRERGRYRRRCLGRVTSFPWSPDELTGATVGDTANTFCHKLILAKAAPYNLLKSPFHPRRSRYPSLSLYLSPSLCERTRISWIWLQHSCGSADPRRHLLKIDVALTFLLFRNLPSTACSLGVSVDVRWNFYTGERLPGGFQFPRHAS